MEGKGLKKSEKQEAFEVQLRKFVLKIMKEVA